MTPFDIAGGLKSAVLDNLIPIGLGFAAGWFCALLVCAAYFVRPFRDSTR